MSVMNYINIVNTDDDLINILSLNPSIGDTYKVGSDFTHSYSSEMIKYSAGEYIIFNEGRFDHYSTSKAEIELLLSNLKQDITVNELDLMYKKFQTWALHWFREQSSSSYIYLESFFAHGENQNNADTNYVDQLLELEKDDGDLEINEGVIGIKSNYSQFKVNIELDFTEWNSNTTINTLTVKAITEERENSNLVEITKSQTIDTTLPKSSISFSYDLRNKKSVKFVFSMDEVDTNWNLTSNVSILGYIVEQNGG